MGLWLKSNGSWVNPVGYWVKSGGVWNSVKAIWVKIATGTTQAAWRLVYTTIVPTIENKVLIAISSNADQTKKLTATLYHWNNSTSVSYSFLKGTVIGAYTPISGAIGTSTNPSTGSSNTNDTYNLNQTDMVKNATNYFVYQSKAVNSTYGTEQVSVSNPVVFEMPRDITDLAVGTVTSFSITLNWSATTGSNRYRVYYTTNPGGTYTLFGETGTTTINVNTGISPSTLYYLKVVPTTGTSNGLGYYGNDSNIVSVTTPAEPTPGAFNITSSTKAYPNGTYSARSVTIAWGASSNANTYEYQIEQSNDNSTWSTAYIMNSTGGVSQYVNYANSSVNNTTTSVSVSGLAYAVYYRVSVRAKSTSGSLITNASNNPFSSVGTAPGDPTGLSAGTISASTASISFTNGTSGSNYYSGVNYKLYTGIPSTTLTLVSDWSSTVYTSPIALSSLTGNTQYTIYLRSVNSDLLTSTGNAYVSFTTIQPSPTTTVNPAVTPTTGYAEVTTYTTDNGTWTNSPTSYTYQWQYYDQGGTFLTIPNTVGTGAQTASYKPPFNFFTLGYQGPIRCRVTATNGGGAGTGFSNNVTVNAPVSPTPGTISWNGINFSIPFVETSGPYFQLYWNSSITAPSNTGYYDAACTTSPMIETFSPSVDTTYYFYLRSAANNVASPSASTTVSGTDSSGLFTNWSTSSTWIGRKLTYNYNGGTGSTADSGIVTSGNSVTLPNPNSRTGYTFNGWYTATSGGTKLGNAGDSYTLSSSFTAYAQWTAATYTVSYDANGGSGAPPSQTKTYGVNLTLSTTTPTPPANKTFVNWNTAQDGTGTSYSSGGTYSTDAAVTLWAQYSSGPQSTGQMRRVTMPIAFTNTSQTIWVGTNGYVSTTVDPTTSPGISWPSAGGVIVGPYVMDCVQTALYTYADTNNFYVRWQGYRYGASGETLDYLMKFYWANTIVDVYFITNNSTVAPSSSSIYYGGTSYSTWASSTSINGMTIPSGLTQVTTTPTANADDGRTAITATKPLSNLTTNPVYGSSTSTSGGWTASISTAASPSGGTYSVVSQTAGSASVNSSTGALTASGLTSGQSSTVTVRYSLSGYNSVDITASGTATTTTSKPPNDPTGLTTPSSGISPNLVFNSSSWTAPATDSTHNAATYYQVYFEASTSSTGPWTAAANTFTYYYNPISTTTATNANTVATAVNVYATSVSSGKVTASTGSYTWVRMWVRAVNGDGYSNWVSAYG